MLPGDLDLEIGSAKTLDRSRLQRRSRQDKTVDAWNRAVWYVSPIITRMHAYGSLLYSVYFLCQQINRSMNGY